MTLLIDSTCNMMSQKYRTAITISFLIIGIVGSYYIITSGVQLFSSSKGNVRLQSNFHNRKDEAVQHSSLVHNSPNHIEVPLKRVVSKKYVIFVIGDSHIFHLNQAIQAGDVKNAGQDFNTQQYVIIYGIPGATATVLRTSKTLKSLLQSKHPDIVFLHIGGNDADSEIPVEDVSENIIEYVKELKKSYGVKEVVLSEQFQRKNIRNIPRNVYDKKIIKLNTALKSGHDHIFWKHIKMNGSNQEILSEDGVHVNKYGQNLFYLSIVDALKIYKKI